MNRLNTSIKEQLDTFTDSLGLSDSHRAAAISISGFVIDVVLSPMSAIVAESAAPMDQKSQLKIASAAVAIALKFLELDDVKGKAK